MQGFVDVNLGDTEREWDYLNGSLHCEAPGTQRCRDKGTAVQWFATGQAAQLPNRPANPKKLRIPVLGKKGYFCKKAKSQNRSAF